MDNSEFVNQYIDTATKALHDLMGKNLISETRATLAEKALASLKTQFDDLKEVADRFEEDSKELADIKPKYESAVSQLKSTETELTELRSSKRECEDMRSRYEQLVRETEQIRVERDSIRNDLNIARNQIAELDRENEEILKSNQELRNSLEVTDTTKPSAALTKKKVPPSKEV